jgi:hypothetical protein
MKKILLGVLAIIASLAFMGCPMERTDQMYPVYSLPIKANVTTTTNANGLTVSATPTSNNYSKYTITIKNLVADVGKQFVVAGEAIGSTTNNIQANWNVTADKVTDQDLVGTVDNTGTFSITFYGKAPSWGDANNGAQFKICRYDDASWNLVLGNSSGDNFCVQGSTGNDITLTIDVGKYNP